MWCVCVCVCQNISLLDWRLEIELDGVKISELVGVEISHTSTGVTALFLSSTFTCFCFFVGGLFSSPLVETESLLRSTLLFKLLELELLNSFSSFCKIVSILLSASL